MAQVQGINQGCVQSVRRKEIRGQGCGFALGQQIGGRQLHLPLKNFLLLLKGDQADFFPGQIPGH